MKNIILLDMTPFIDVSEGCAGEDEARTSTASIPMLTVSALVLGLP
jgi:hypothetical protein